MRVNTAETQAVIHKLFGKTAEEVCKQTGIRNVFGDGTKYPWGVHQTNGNHSYEVFVSIGFKGYVNILSFAVAYYPSCCGTKLFHSFSIDEGKVNQEQLNEIMTTFFRENSGMFSSRRLEVIMVENRYNKDCSDYAHKDPMDEPEPIENPQIIYKSLWNYFHTKTKRVRTRLEVNANTSNVLHNMEVILF